MQLNFNAAEVNPSDSFEPLPVGWYQAIVTDSEEKQTKSGNGSYLQLTLEVTEGSFAGRKLWARLNLNNPNPTAVEIAQRELSAICHAVGVLAPQQSEELHFKPLMIKVKLKEFEGEKRNEIGGFKSLGESPKPVAKATSGKPPWQQR